MKILKVMKVMKVLKIFQYYNYDIISCSISCISCIYQGGGTMCPPPLTQMCSWDPLTIRVKIDKNTLGTGALHTRFYLNPCTLC